MAGERIDDALSAIHTLEGRGLRAILDSLGEFVTDETGAGAATEDILAALDALGAQPVERQMSVKPTQLGLGLRGNGELVALQNGRSILKRAVDVDAHVCLDMEDSSHVDGTLEVFRALHADFGPRVSTVLQSYLYRSPADLQTLLALEPRPAVRIVKGAYAESSDVALHDKRSINEAFIDMTYRSLEAGAHVNVATHDEALIRRVEGFIRGGAIPPDRYEFQMLYGVRPALQEELAAAGHPVRVYVPFGADWYGYYSRRLAERPANLFFMIRSFIRDSGRKEYRHV